MRPNHRVLRNRKRREAGRDNLLLQSNGFDTTWTNLNSTETAGVAANPIDGALDAWGLNEDSTLAASHGLSQAAISANITAGDQVCLSAYVKASNRSWFMMALDVQGGGETRGYFDIGNGALGNIHANLDDAGILYEGDGWWRPYIVITVGASTGTIVLRVAEGDLDVTFDGQNQESLKIYGAMLNKGDYPGTYIPTTTAQYVG